MSSTSWYFIKYSKPCIGNQHCICAEDTSTLTVIKWRKKKASPTAACWTFIAHLMHGTKVWTFLASKWHLCKNKKNVCKSTAEHVYRRKQWNTYQRDICIKCKSGLIQLHVKLFEWKSRRTLFPICWHMAPLTSAQATYASNWKLTFIHIASKQVLRCV